ncbi:MAG TPA: hypothetical protein VGG73_15105 [Vicinamibacterales bacterium]
MTILKRSGRPKHPSPEGQGLNAADLRTYLLGQSTEAQAERVEVRALDDEDFYVTLQSFEDDLFDEYARGTMPEVDRKPFRTRYSGERHRLVVARALSARVESPSGTSKYWLLAAAAVVLTAVGATLAIRTKSASPTPAATVAASAPATPPVPAPVALLLTLGTSRSAAAVPEVRLPSSSSSLRLRVRLDPADTFDSYAMELRSAQGELVWRADALKATVQGGDRLVIGDIPAKTLAATSYELSVTGSSAANRPEVLGFAAMSIR